MDELRTKEAPSLAPERERELLAFNEASGIGIDDLDLLDLAFTHRSHANETGDRTRNNERLEFLGDSILGLAVADLLLEAYPDKEEGELSKIKSIVVSEDSLALAAKKLNVAQYLLLGKGRSRPAGGERKRSWRIARKRSLGRAMCTTAFRRRRRSSVEPSENGSPLSSKMIIIATIKRLFKSTCRRSGESCPPTGSCQKPDPIITSPSMSKWT